MPNIGADEIITQKHVRTWVQFGGAGAANEVQYYGQDWQYAKVEGLSTPDGQGAVTPVYVHDPSQAGKFRLVARQVAAPDLANATLILLEKHGFIPRQLQKIGCPFNLYEVVGVCKDLSDFLNGWSDYVLVYQNALVNGLKSHGNRSAWGESDTQLEDSLPIVLDDVFPVGALGFGEKAASTITLEAIDAVYWSNEQCGDCGPTDDGTKWIYSITKSSGSTPGTAPKLVYTVDGGDTWTAGTVDGLGDTEDAVAIDRVGKYLVVLTQTAGGATTSGYYYSEVNTKTGVPGTWTKVTTGFVSPYIVYDMFVLSPREVFFCAAGGYIYKSTDIPSGVSVISAGDATALNLFRIHGDGAENIVAVGAAGVVVASSNRGETWATVTNYPEVATINAICVLDENNWWTGTVSGKLWYTQDGGASAWTEKTFSGSGSGSVRDIVAVNQSVLYFSHDTTAPLARLFSTWNGGADWTMSSPRIVNMPTCDRFNRIAVPRVAPGVAANNVALAGLNGNGTDGVLLIGIAGRL